MVIKRPVIISACLLGLGTRYDGCGCFNTPAINDAGSFLIPVCPEQLGGLSTPRKAAHIDGGSAEDVLFGKARVIDIEGVDLTDHFLRGAMYVRDIVNITGSQIAFFKEKSPSCGVNAIYREGGLALGSGITTVLLKRMGLNVIGY